MNDQIKLISENMSDDGSILSESNLGGRCSNKVYRRGTVMRCTRIVANESVCSECKVALESIKNKLLGISEAKKEPANKPDELEVDDEFEVHDGMDDKKKPDFKQKRKSSLKDGPDGAGKMKFKK